MGRTYEITDGNTTTEVGFKAIEGGILHRGFHLTNKKLEAEIRESEPYLLPTEETESEKITQPIEPEDEKKVEPVVSDVPAKEPAQDVNQLAAAPVVPKPQPDFTHALTLSVPHLDKYAASFGCKLDGRKALETLRAEFAEFCGVEYTPEQEEPKAEEPQDLTCPHCGTKARTLKSYNNNHGDKCYKALKVK